MSRRVGSAPTARRSGASSHSAWPLASFRRFWAATASSSTGIQAAEVVLPALAVLSLGATAQQLSWVRVAQFLPFLLLTLWLGVVVDRRRKRPLMIAADLVRGTTLLSLGVAAAAGHLTVPLLVAGAAVVGSFTVLHQLASFSFVPAVVSPDRLPDANARIAGTESALEVGGGSVGGAAVQAIAAPLATVANGLCFLAGAALLTRVPADNARPPPRTTGTIAAARAGLTALRRHRIVRPLATEASVWNLGWEVFLLALTVEFLTMAGHGPLLLGLVLACGGLGGLAGSLTSASLTRRFGYGPSLVVTMVVGNSAPLVGVAAVALGAPTPTTYMVALLVSGFGIGIANSQAITVRQLVVDEQLRGRVNSAYRLVGFSMLALGAAAGGFLVESLGVRVAAFFGCGLMTAACIPVALSPVRRMRTTSSLEEEAELMHPDPA